MAIPIEIAHEESFNKAFDPYEVKEARWRDWKAHLDFELACKPIGTEIIGKPNYFVRVMPETGIVPRTRVIYRYDKQNDPYKVYFITFEIVSEAEICVHE